MLARLEKFLIPLPKRQIVALAIISLIAGAAFGAWGVKNWVSDVNEVIIKYNLHAIESAGGYARLAAVESDTRVMKEELRQMRLDQLEHYKWMAESLGDYRRAEKMERSIIKLNGEKR